MLIKTPGAARKTDPETSHEAARRANESMQSDPHLYMRMMITVVGVTDPWCQDELADRYMAKYEHEKRSWNTIRRRVTDLERAGLIIKVGKKRHKGSNKKTFCVSIKGEQWMREQLDVERKVRANERGDAR